MLNEFKEHIRNHFPELQKNKFLLACSGGLDSVVLAHLCALSGLDFYLAHCNFKLRGTESDEDEQFVGELSQRLGKTVFIKQFNTKAYIENHKVSLQMAARELRYEWFRRLMEEHTIQTLVTAHHLDDSLETFFINLSRGTGIKGLIGIPPKTATISRPLLSFSREKLLQYAKREKMDWREDSSNTETKYLRNKIRHEIVPVLKELHPTFIDNFQQTQEFLKQIADISDNHINLLKEDIFQEDGEVNRIKIASLQALKPLEAYLHGFFGVYGFTEWEDLQHLLTAMSGKEVRSRTHRLVKDRDFLLLTKIADDFQKEFQITIEDTEIQIPIGLSISGVHLIEEVGPKVLYVDKETLKYPLVLRKWQKGDYFYPLGLGGRKKLSKFFKDEKIDILTKEKQWLLCSDNQIVWVVGKRADERFKITANTKNILKIKVH